MRTLPLMFLLLIPTGLFSQTRTIHVLVALCDNVNQGIVPVPKKIGNGQDPDNNLYWGCGFGVRTFLKQQPDWKLLAVQKNPSTIIYERLVFRHRDSSVYLIADAYNGTVIRQTTTDLLDYAAGKNEVAVTVDSLKIMGGGRSDLICYVGHNGLMDFALDDYPANTGENKRAVVILACASKNYFYGPVKKAGADPLLWTTNLMCPEAYTLDAAIDSWIRHDSPAALREKSAQVYNKYQKCGIAGARNLLVTGF
jgi:hypothetical protein